jgi:hypothetical protein
MMRDVLLHAPGFKGENPDREDLLELLIINA